MMKPSLTSMLSQSLHQYSDPYQQLNGLRDWVNAHLSDYELYLEDVWNDRTPGETHFEYILRSRKTYEETEVIGYDIYKNHQDAGGVWHLDDYITSILLMASVEPLVEFIRQNGWPEAYSP